jgi:hypothetical protein
MVSSSLAELIVRALFVLVELGLLPDDQRVDS